MFIVSLCCRENTNMKNVLIILGLLISNLGLNAQTPIGPKFNEKFADSLLFEKINQKRIELGKTPYVKSDKVSKYISQRNVGIMVSKSALFHPGYKWEDDSVMTKNVVSIYKDYKKMFPNNKNFSPSSNRPYRMTYAEVALRGENYSYYETYEKLIDVMIQGWYNSLGHRVILLGDDVDLEFNQKSFIGVSIKIDKNGYYYSAANVVSF